ncbi:hypothetical protein GCM10012275_10730 [Longimycelium tulufanense]|uniref:Transposase n=1 Tax=Longimycelium tulufanense TaxID=907463 RepID=A0A8J3FTL8_9PSEU|nr:hypothetical protein GCM10012275_10730 [Longimycelium tulufanense]
MSVRQVSVAVSVVFSRLSPLVVDDVIDGSERTLVRARTSDVPAACPGPWGEVRTCARVAPAAGDGSAIDGRPVTVWVRVRRLVCPTLNCHTTFREQVPGVLERYQRRTTHPTVQERSVVRELAGQAGARVLSALSIQLSRHSALVCLLRTPAPPAVGSVPTVLSVDDFALRRRHRPPQRGTTC